VAEGRGGGGASGKGDGRQKQSPLWEGEIVRDEACKRPKTQKRGGDGTTNPREKKVR